MKQKIEWYKEVLELEPGSRVFFPLAKLLATDGQLADAVHSLHQGLLRHPDHVEARLLLVELLFLQNANSELGAEIERLGALFAAYPGFWKAWSAHLSATPAMRDASLALRFFAAALQGKNVSWGEIIEHGISSLLGTEKISTSPSFAAHSPSAQEQSAMRRSVNQAPVPPVMEELSPPQEEKSTIDHEIPQPLPDSVVSFSAETTVSPLPVASVASMALDREEHVDEIEEEESEEAFSIRTRSMAEVLAEQGDVAGALDIYQELMQTADPEEKSSLMARAEELTHRMSNGSVPEVGRAEEKSKASGGESTKLVSLLESLAQRLEARAR